MPPSVIGTSRRERREAARGRASIEFGADADAALDVFELLELAWHDCHGEITPPAPVVDDVWTLAGGNLSRLVSTSRLAVTDWRDLRVSADDVRLRHTERV